MSLKKQLSHKTCSCCHRTLPIEDFYLRRGKSRKGDKIIEYYDSLCKKCKLSKNSEWQKNNPDKMRVIQSKHYFRNKEHRLENCRKFHRKRPNWYKDYLDAHKEMAKYSQIKYLYGLSKEEYDKLPKQCEICGSTKRLCVDHDHKTGKVRGMLCHNCNAALGFLKENRTIVAGMLSYIDTKC